MVIGIAATMLGSGTLSYFSDSEIAVGNTFSAGTIDLKIDVNESTHMQEWPCGGTQHVEQPICFEEKDLVAGDKVFDWHDIKPGDFGEATISIHVYDNDAWFWMRFTNIVQDLEFSENISVFLWVDDGVHDGFGNDPKEFNPGDLRCPPTGGEGDNIWQEQYETEIIFQGNLSELFEQCNPLFTQIHLEACTTYYIGWAWKVPVEVGNEVQGDSITFDIEFYAQQYRNNEFPTNPWE